MLQIQTALCHTLCIMKNKITVTTELYLVIENTFDIT